MSICETPLLDYYINNEFMRPEHITLYMLKNKTVKEMFIVKKKLQNIVYLDVMLVTHLD